ncbi:MAG: flagellar biosynthesis anti-sigma factor FlgM [Woeseiaceae bacterium]|jgi:negative regulator of flagellin synthesis FlgM
MDHGTLGKIGGKVDEAGTSSKVSKDSTAPDKASVDARSATDTVNLTSDAKLLERLDKTLAALPAVDSARVAEIKSAIENGDYQIDSDAIAEAMIRLDRSFGE